ncbi:hypothetical protein BMS3Abin15_00752 [bacterium BMS3Abin15]|nr:hypothetical protein BMS3Abin15_00752 [bacterium BMS3Abin15]HDH07506.1 hypothetical protein [Candidatus Moranbacteria bacterium]HDZ85677.1 hypothetical protein [Candidatus Moranbacteria bacterium]
MYWVYLIIFVIMVLAPDIVEQGYFFLDEEKSEEVFILFLGMIAVLIFLWKERQLKLNLSEKRKIQKEFSRVSKDLKDSYSYIGETNRKLDILKNIALGLPDPSGSALPNKTRAYDTIIEAVKTLGKTNKFGIRLVDDISNNTKKEFRGNSRIIFKIRNNSLKLMEKENFLKNDDYFIFRSPQKIDNIRAYIIIQRERNNQIEDPGLMKTLATQTLLLYTLLKKSSIDA